MKCWGWDLRTILPVKKHTEYAWKKARAHWIGNFATWLGYLASQITNYLTVIGNIFTWVIELIAQAIGVIGWFFTNVVSLIFLIPSLLIAIFTGRSVTVPFTNVVWDFSILNPFIGSGLALTTLVAVFMVLMHIKWFFMDGLFAMPGKIRDTFSFLKDMFNSFFFIFRWSWNEFISIYNFIRSHIPTIGGGGGEQAEA